MPLADNPHDDAVAADARLRQEDPWAMYYVVCTDQRLSLGEACVTAGAAAVICADRFRAHPYWQEAFAAWQQESYRKIALRASPEQYARVLAEFPDVEPGERLLCLPPLRKSQRPSVLVDLAPFTDAKAPVGAADRSAEEPAMTYVLRPAVMKSSGKAMAQAGHGALMCADAFAVSYAPALASWRERGCPGVVRFADDAQWQQIKAQCDCVAVTDAGLTQLVPGTETVLALPPAAAPAWMRTLERVR